MFSLYAFKFIKHATWRIHLAYSPPIGFNHELEQEEPSPYSRGFPKKHKATGSLREHTVSTTTWIGLTTQSP